jgi:hypothetical protein
MFVNVAKRLLHKQRLTVLAIVLVVAGCGARSYPVHGQVVWSDGTPAKELAGGFVTFDSEEADLSARGEISTDGSFVLSNLKKDDGLPPGRYQVMVAAPEPDPSEPPDSLAVKGRNLLPPKYQIYETSGLAQTVEAKPNQITLRIDKAEPSGPEDAPPPTEGSALGEPKPPE